VNGKQYVGQTVRPLDVRWRGHKRSAENGSKCAIHRAIRRYGADSFKVEQIDTADFSEELSKKELSYILELKTFSPEGYNLTTGGEGYNISEETRKKQSLAHLGLVFSEEHKQKLSESNVRTHCKYGHPFDEVNTYVNPNTGRRHCLACNYITQGRELPQKLQYLLSEIEIQVSVTKCKKTERHNLVVQPLKTHCKCGHPFDTVNTYILPSTGKSRCLACHYLDHGLSLPPKLQYLLQPEVTT
jgi:group I intron endonuclease